MQHRSPVTTVSASIIVGAASMLKSAVNPARGDGFCCASINIDAAPTMIDADTVVTGDLCCMAVSLLAGSATIDRLAAIIRKEVSGVRSGSE